MNTSSITRSPVPEAQRIKHVDDIFGIHFPMQLEPFIFSIAENIAEQYKGGYWEFFALSNGGFYMAPNSDSQFHVVCENGFEGTLSADALGITVCLYAYSNLSFGGSSSFTVTCAEQYHLLREYMFEHPEVGSILGAID